VCSWLLYVVIVSVTVTISIGLGLGAVVSVVISTVAVIFSILRIFGSICGIGSVIFSSVGCCQCCHQCCGSYF